MALPVECPLGSPGFYNIQIEAYKSKVEMRLEATTTTAKKS
jgi:hypothetical protein